MATEITVRGSYSEYQPPERATVHASIAYEGPAMEPVYARVARDLESVKASIIGMKADHGPVTWWSAEQLRTWSNRPWNQEGKRLPLVHHASVVVEVRFRDFAALSRWVGEHTANTEGFRISSVQWALTANRREALFKEVRTRAVQDAVSRAQQYSEALGLGQIRPLAIADAGMLGAHREPEAGRGAAYMRAAAVGGAPEVDLVPEHIEVTAAVDARFIVGTPQKARRRFASWPNSKTGCAQTSRRR